MNKLTYEKVLEKANILLKNEVQETYMKSHPDLDLNLVRVLLNSEVEMMFRALIETINEVK